MNTGWSCLLIGVDTIEVKATSTLNEHLFQQNGKQVPNNAPTVKGHQTSATVTVHAQQSKNQTKQQRSLHYAPQISSKRHDK